MIRNLKALGLALCAMLALGAVAASGASAQQGHLTSETGEAVTLVGTEGAGVNALTSFGRSVECPGSTYTGHEVDSTSEPKALVPNGATNTTITPDYTQHACVTGDGQSTTIEMNSCDYEFELGETTPAGNENGTYGLKAFVRCDEAGDEIHRSTYNNEHHEDERLCTTEIPAQGPLTGAHATNEGNKVRAHGTFTDIEVTRHGLCVLDGQGTTTNAGELHLDVLVEGRNEVGETVGISVSD